MQRNTNSSALALDYYYASISVGKFVLHEALPAYVANGIYDSMDCIFTSMDSCVEQVVRMLSYRLQVLDDTTARFAHFYLTCVTRLGIRKQVNPRPSSYVFPTVLRLILLPV